MMILFWFLLVVFILVCILLAFLILIQSDKGGGISGAIGGGLGGASNLLGTQDTANILTRGTVIFGSVFLLLCVLLSFVVSKQTVTVEKSLLQQRAEKQQSYSPSSVLDQSLPLQGEEAAPGAPSGETPSGEAPGLPGVAPGQQQGLPMGAPKEAPSGQEQ